MAIANSDGSIILSTKVDTSGLNQGMSQMQGKASGLTKTFSKLGAAIASAFAIQKIIQFSNESASLATQTEASVQRLVDIYGSASTAVGDFIDQNARALGMSKSAAASFSSVYGNLFSAFADQETNAALTNEYLRMTAVVASKTGRTVEDVQERIRSGLLGNTEAIEDLGIFVNVKTIEMTDAFQRMADGKSWEQLDAYTQQQIRSMAILEQATAKYGDEVADTSTKIRNEFNAAYQDFQNSWGTIVNQVLLPVLQVLTQIFNIATVGLNALSGRSGKILEDAEVIADNSEETAENIEEQTESQKALNKELKKSLAGFDDIQILSSQTADNTSGGLDGGLQGIGGDLGGTLDSSAYVDEVDETLTNIMGIAALTLAAIGIILLFSGNIGWGIGFIIAGAALLTVTEAAWTKTDEASTVDGVISHIMERLDQALAAVGIILLFKGKTGWGVGFLVAGAAFWAISEIWGEQDDLSDATTVVENIMQTIGVSLAAVGLMLLFKGIFSWGIGFIVAGAEIWAITEFATGEFSEEPIINTLVKIMGIAGTALAALGIILLVFGQIIWGVTMLAVGAVMLVTALALNNEAIVEAIRGPLGVIVAIVGAALLVLGIILVCTGVGIPLGIALIAAGAASLVTVVALNWDAIVEWVKGAWEAVQGFWNKYIAPIFTAEFWLDLAKKCGNGLISGFENAINGIIGMFEKMINWIVGGLNKISFGVPDWVPGIGGKTFGFNIPKVEFDRVSIPRLAQGSVIPPNREFLAVLGDQKQGTNIEAPLQTIVDAFNIALQQSGGYNGGGNTEVVLEIDGREFGRAVVEQGNRENRRIGTRLVVR